MWSAVEYFRGRIKRTPQFHGKWPFVRLGGIQEPASALFSVANFIAFAYMLTAFLRMVPSEAPMYYAWTLYCCIGMIAWICSTIFHSRDTPLTEKLDYFCAFAGVLYSLFCCLLRITGKYDAGNALLIAFPIAAYFLCHITYLSFVKFDYGYNMKANVLVGTLNSIGWLGWCASHLELRTPTSPSDAADSATYWSGLLAWAGPRLTFRYPHLGNCIAVVLLASAFLSLELWDFPPVGWTLDAHSLWHLGTAPLPFLWTKFIVYDCKLLHREQLKRAELKAI
jgi:hypothetical protein